MGRLLITGFDPFGGESINPSWEAVRLLADRIGDYEITKLRIPVVFGAAADAVINKAEKISADVIICVGQAGGRAGVTPELVGINHRYADIPDNCGNKPHGVQIIPGGPAAYFSTIPVRAIAEAIKSAAIAASVSYSAGAYVCNDTLYTLLSHFDKSGTRVGFIHIPYCSEQKKEPAMELSEIARALTVAIETLDK